MSILAEVYEPPETTGAAGAGAEEDEGAWVGCCKPLPELEPLFELELAELELDDDAGWLVEAAAEEVCP